MIKRSVNGKAGGQSKSNKLKNIEQKSWQVEYKSQDKDKINFKKPGLRMFFEEKTNCAIHLQSYEICIAELHYISVFLNVP